MRNRTRLLALLGALALVLVACGDEGGSGDASGGGAKQSVTVTAADFSFAETEIQVDPGATVDLTLDNTGDAKHSFTSDDLDVEIEAEGGAEASTTFDAPDSGTFEFHCEYHPDAMTGQIVVGEGGASDTGGSGGGGPAEDDTDY
ncbi:MAG: cupredoxin domain-containing protein [Actinomycetota bacterium]